MNTRFAGQQVQGYYHANDSADIEVVGQLSNELPRFMTAFRDLLEYQVLKQLKMRKSIFRSGNFLIEKKIFDYLKATYDLKGIYKVNIPFMEVLNLTNVRFENQTDFSSFENKRFEMRICKQKIDFYYDENFSKKKNSNNRCRFFFRFVRQDLVRN